VPGIDRLGEQFLRDLVNQDAARNQRDGKKGRHDWLRIASVIVDWFKLRTLRQVLAKREYDPPGLVAALRQALVATYASQVILIGLTALGVLWLTPRAPKDGFAWWFLLIGFAIFVFMALFAERAFWEDPSTRAGLHLAILLGVSSSLLAILGFLALVLEGLTLGVAALLISSGAALYFCILRLEGAALRIPPPEFEAKDGTEQPLDNEL
jgi:hypothetical protein